MHHCSTLIQLFNECFLHTYNTELCGGGQEPVYQPARCSTQYHRIVFTRDYFASALHEVAHWCVAGAARRQCEDYGYWYAPDGRSAAQQKLFEQVEAKPQALEWLFSRAANYRFRLSADNLSSNIEASSGFAQCVSAQARLFCREGVNVRAGRFIQSLCAHYGVSDVYSPDYFSAHILVQSQ